VKLSQVLEELVEEKGLDKNIVTDIVCQELQSTYAKKYPTYQLEVAYNRKTDDMQILTHKQIVSAVEDNDKQISLRKARSLDPAAKISDTISVPFELPLGRIEIFKVKQNIAQHIKNIEYAEVYKTFKPKEGTIIQGTIHKIERAGVLVKVEDTLAFLPKSLMIPDEKYTPGYMIRGLLKEVFLEPRNENQLILDRSSSEFLVRLFELEIPEIYEKLVELKKVVRIAGYKSKIIVVSHDKNIDPVGTCVGVGGARIKPILRELGNEKIDIIELTGSVEQLVMDALKPATINRVVIKEDKTALVWLDDDQRSLAIGRMGQNIQLASQLVVLKIELNKHEVVVSPFNDTTHEDIAPEHGEAENSKHESPEVIFDDQTEQEDSN
jgi:N utilization substance protein A